MKEKLKLNNLIAISGVRGSGKNETANMLQYCLSVPKIFRQYWIYNIFNKIVPKKYKLIAFADPLKKMLSILLNIPFERFNDRAFKELVYINIPTLEQIFPKQEDKVSDSKFNKMVKDLDPELANCNLSIRQLMQYFGTNVFRTFFGDKVWINSTLRNASRNTIITDLRFKIEMKAVKELHGKIIYVNRSGYFFGQHASEREMEELLNTNQYDYVLYNNDTLKSLFYNIKDITNDIERNNN